MRSCGNSVIDGGQRDNRDLSAWQTDVLLRENEDSESWTCIAACIVDLRGLDLRFGRPARRCAPPLHKVTSASQNDFFKGGDGRVCEDGVNVDDVSIGHATMADDDLVCCSMTTEVRCYGGAAVVSCVQGVATVRNATFYCW